MFNVFSIKPIDRENIWQITCRSRSVQAKLLATCKIGLACIKGKFLTVHYETTGIFFFQNRDSESLLRFEEGHPLSKNHT